MLGRKGRDRVVDEAAVEKLEPFCIAGKSVKWCSHWGERIEISPKEKCTCRITRWPYKPLPSHISSIKTATQYGSTDLKAETTHMSVGEWVSRLWSALTRVCN